MPEEVLIVPVTYPAAGGSSPTADWAGWQQLGKAQRERLQVMESGLAAQRRSMRPDDQPLTTARLQSVADGLKHNLDAIDSILQPLNVPASTGFKRFLPGTAANSVRPPQNAERHIDLNNLRYLLRDWSIGVARWGQSEIAAMLDVLRPAYQGIETGRPLIVAGAGAMRLPLEIARDMGASRCTLIELDALLCHASAELVSGRKINLTEIPDEPVARPVIPQQLEMPAGWLAGLSVDIQCGDANELVPAALLSAEAPMLFTPFIIDVAGGDILQRCRRWVAAMPKGSRWLNIGPISVREPHSRMNYGIDEVRDCLQKAGLVFDYDQQCLIPHLSSPHNRRQQQYWCWAFSGVRR